MKRSFKLVSLVLALVMLTVAAVIPVSSEQADEVYERYQRVRKIATIDQNENVFASSEELFAIDNVIYNGNGKKVKEIPLVTNNEKINVVSYLDGKFAYTFYTDVYHEEGWYSSQLMDATTGKVIADYEKNFHTDWENNAYSVGGDLYIDGNLVKSFDCAGVLPVGGGVYLTLAESDYVSEKTDPNAERYIYDNYSGEAVKLENAVFPMAFIDGQEIGWAATVNADGTLGYYFMMDRRGNKVNDLTYDNVLFDDDRFDVFVGYSKDEPGKIHLIDSEGTVIHLWDESEVPYEIFDNYVITRDENDLFRIYERSDYATDGKTYGWYSTLDSDSFTVGDGSYDVETDTPDYIYDDANATVTETALNCVIPVRDGKYLVSADYETGIQTVYDREMNVVCVMNAGYEDIYGLEEDDILLAETKDGKFGFVSYKDEILIPFDYDAEMTVDLMQRFTNGNLLVALGYTENDKYYQDIYLITYHDTAFTDVKNGAWFVDAVNYVYSTGLMNGKTDTTFAPNEQMTRAQLVTVLWRMAGSPEVEFTNRFSDVKKATLWYAPAVMWAAENGIVDGFPDGTFAPGDPLTRDQLAAILFRYTEFAGGDTSAKGELGTFTDGEKVQKWARSAVEWAVGVGVISGKPDGDSVAVAPKAHTTRAEVATVMMRYLNK